ncbi:phosphate ABC transporter substrate-binding protein PstS [Rubritepida flocculans]|uniref:phosphate ABC transporter substrate-binding protein PstS n=1 Tax=Rubritepida flocculans TaxID=182403 RepID=UPI0003FCDC54|nr:phosphate ABC transporter substrate-binding protein PstS [Rubritepida flocculans]
MNRRSLLALAASGVAAPALLRPAFAQQVQITGAGATFPRPLYDRWSAAARDAIGVSLNYQSIGSGGGINQIAARTVDFGASDAPLTTAQLTERNLLQFPTVMGSVVLSVNIPGVADNALRLTPELIIEIFFGRVQFWNDPRIVELNRELRLPRLPVSVGYRADGSGTTWVWTTYLSRISEEWRNGPGAGTSVRWPFGNGARGNEGVSNIIRNTPGAIGYIENAYAVVNRMITTQIRNKAGQFVRPVPETFNATAAAADWTAPNFAPDTIDLALPNVWPATSPTYILLPTNPVADRVAGSRNTMRFFDWAFRNGSQIASSLEYIPLPTSAHNLIRAAWARSVRDPSGNPIWTGPTT